MSPRETYRKIAKACVHAAERMRDPGERVIMLEIAQAYLRLADRVAARLKRGTADRADDQD
jgi:hypothetical protein